MATDGEGGQRELGPAMHDLETAIAAFALAPIGVSITRDGVTEHCNPAYLRMFGYDGHADEIYGRSLILMIAPEHRPAVLAQIESRRIGATVEASYDTWGLRRDGSTFPFHVAVRKMMLSGVARTLAFFMDLSDHRRIEEDLRRARDQLSALVEASPVPTMMLDAQGRVLVWNPAAVTVFGWTPEEAIGRQNPLVGPDHEAEYARNVSLALAGRLQAIPARRRRKDGRPVDIELFAAPVHDSARKPMGVMALTVDVTERNRTEEALRQSEEQLRHAQKMEAVGQLAGGVAHDFNNVLTVVAAVADVLGQHLLTPEARALAGATDEANEAAECLAELRQAVVRATALTRQLLAFSRRQVLSPRSVDLGEIVRGMEPMLRTLAGSTVQLALDLASDLGAARADPGQMEQVIANLAINGRDAMPGGGVLMIRTRNVEVSEATARDYFPVPPDRYVAIAVTDAGVGMSEGVLARIFEPFFTTKERGKGTGLGLSTVFGIVKQSGGHIRVASQVGLGSTFEVFLPRLVSEHATTPAEVAGPSAVTPATVVLVEDDRAIRTLTRGLLERGGMVVREAHDGEHALTLLATADRRSLVLLTDVLMAGMNGPQLAELALAEDPGLPVIFMSGYPDPEAFPERVRRRAAGFLAKPFEAATLLRMVSEAARGRTGTA